MGALAAYDEHYSYDDYKIWEGDWELIGGFPYAMSPKPMIKHQMVSGKIFSELDNKICEKCIAAIEIDYRVSDDTVVSPDVLVACGDDLGEQYLRKTPEIVFEILSPSTAKRDRGIKYQLYEGQAIKYYVIVNSQMKTAEVYRLVEGRFILDKNVSDDEYRLEIDSCEIDFVFKNIWA